MNRQMIVKNPKISPNRCVELTSIHRYKELFYSNSVCKNNGLGLHFPYQLIDLTMLFSKKASMNVMKNTFVLALVFVLLMSLSDPVHAQYRKDAHVDTAPVEVYDSEQMVEPFSFRSMFSRDRFDIRHSYSLSTSSFGGQGLTTGAFTSSVLWRMSNKLYARADVSLLHTPFGTGDFSQSLGSNSLSGVYLENAEIMYRPSENTSLHLSFHQRPGGVLGYANGYGNGYGYGRPYGYNNRYNRSSASFGW